MNTFSGLFKSFLKQTNSFVRFLLVGVVNTCIGLTITFLFLNVFDLGYWPSTFLGYTMGAISSFLLNRTVTFKSSISFVKGTPRFLLVVLSCYVLAFQASELVCRWIYIGTDGLDVMTQNEMAVLLGTTLYTVMNYFGQKIVVFKGPKNASQVR